MRSARPARWSALCLTVGAAWMTGSHPCSATTLKRMDLPELVRKADRVVHARALDQRVYWDASGTQIHTDTTFEVVAEAKGRGPSRVTVSLLGGRIDPAEMLVEGTPTFSTGEEVVLFTSPRPDGKKNLVGFSQGVLRLLDDPSTGAKMAAGMVPTGVQFVEESGGRLSVVHPRPTPVPLEALMTQIRGLVESGRPAGPSVSRTPARLDGKPSEEGRP